LVKMMTRDPSWNESLQSDGEVAWHVKDVGAAAVAQEGGGRKFLVRYLLDP
jgi:hypothetical protein